MLWIELVGVLRRRRAELHDTQVRERFKAQATLMKEAASSLGQHVFLFGNAAPRQRSERVFQNLDHVSIDVFAGGLHE